MDKKQFEQKNSEIEMLRSGMNDNVNIITDDELGELFGGLHCGKGYCRPKYGNKSCPNHYCQRKFSKD